MNTKKIIVLSGLMLVFLSLSSFKSITNNVNESIINVETQDGLVVYATYKGKTDAGYNFVVKDRNGGEQALVFKNVDTAVLADFDLNTKTLVGTILKVTFNKGANETNTITKLENLPKY